MLSEEHGEIILYTVLLRRCVSFMNLSSLATNSFCFNDSKHSPCYKKLTENVFFLGYIGRVYVIEAISFQVNQTRFGDYMVAKEVAIKTSYGK